MQVKLTNQTMKKLITSLIVLLIASISYGQYYEPNFSVFTNAFTFKGESVNTNTPAYIGTNNVHYTTNPYSSSLGFGYGVSYGYSYVGRSRVFGGFDIAYEHYQNQKTIDQIILDNYSDTLIMEADGKIKFSHGTINSYFYTGYRLAFNDDFHIDFTGGIDLGIIIDSKEKGEVTANNGNTYEIDRKVKRAVVDYRPRVQVRANYRNFALFGAYSHGLNTYVRDDGNMPIGEAKSRLFRVGLTFTFVRFIRKGTFR